MEYVVCFDWSVAKGWSVNLDIFNWCVSCVCLLCIAYPAGHVSKMRNSSVKYGQASGVVLGITLNLKDHLAVNMYIFRFKQSFCDLFICFKFQVTTLLEVRNDLMCICLN